MIDNVVTNYGIKVDAKINQNVPQKLALLQCSLILKGHFLYRYSKFQPLLSLFEVFSQISMHALLELEL